MKRILAVFLCLCLIGLGVFLSFAKADPLTKDTDGYYPIGTYEELKAFAALVNGGEDDAKGKLTADITATDQTWDPIGNGGTTEYNVFRGIFDGQGHVISGLSNAGVLPVPRMAGLVGVNRGTVKNVGVGNGDFRAYFGEDLGSAVAGGIAGSNERMIENCWFDGSVFASKKNPMAGGIAGINAGTIQNCYHIGDVIYDDSNNGSSSGFGGGIAGVNSGTVRNCFHSGRANRMTLSGSGHYGSIAAYNTGTIQNCCFDLDVFSDEFTEGSGELNAKGLPTAKMQGANALANMGFENTDGIWITHADGYPTLRVFTPYAITWKDDKGNVLKTDWMAYGGMPSYNGQTPAKDPDEFYTAYTFDSWDPAPAAVTGDQTYTATFRGTIYQYFIKSKQGAEYVLKSGVNAVVEADRRLEPTTILEDVEAVQMDGQDIPKGSRTLTKGSVVVTLKSSYLDTLSVGKHELKVAFRDGGSVTTPVTVKDAPNPVPKTGDASDLLLWGGLMILGILGMAAGITGRRRKE